MTRNEAIKRYKLSKTMILALEGLRSNLRIHAGTHEALTKRGIFEDRAMDAMTASYAELLTPLGELVMAALMKGRLRRPLGDDRSPLDRFHITWQRHYHLELLDRRNDSEELSSRDVNPEGFTRVKAWEWVQALQKTNINKIICVSWIKVWKIDPTNSDELGELVWEWEVK